MGDTAERFVSQIFIIMGMSNGFEKGGTVRPQAKLGWGFPRLFCNIRNEVGNGIQ